MYNTYNQIPSFVNVIKPKKTLFSSMLSIMASATSPTPCAQELRSMQTDLIKRTAPCSYLDIEKFATAHILVLVFINKQNRTVIDRPVFLCYNAEKS